MNEPPVAIACSRRGRRVAVFYFILMLLVVLTGPLLCAAALVFLLAAHHWAIAALGLVEVLLFSCFTPCCFRLFISSWHVIRHNGPALLVSREGLTDNVSGNALGRLRWSEIQRMHPWTLEFRLLPNRYFSTPVLAKHRGVVIILKENYLLKQAPWLKPLWLRLRDKTGRFRWIFVPEKLIETSPEELIERINQFYTAQVRGPVQ